MVRTWNSEPSTIQNGTHPLADTSKSFKFNDVPRFVNDGTTRPDRIPNFVNGWDGQGLELPPKPVETDTNTHTTYAERLAAAKAVLELADAVEKSLWTPPAMKSARVKSATPRTLLSNDTRYELLKDPYAEPIGPGSYWVEGGRPDLGTLPLELPSRGSSPARDPARASPPFLSPRRGALFPIPDVPDRMYLSPDYTPGNDKAVAWNMSRDERPPAVDYRFNARVSDARREVPTNSEYPASRVMDCNTRPTQIADQQVSGSAIKIAFNTREPRLITLPTARHNDIRLVRPTTSHRDDTAHLGPGAYTAPTSMGGPKRKTYRLFSDPLPPGIIGAGSPRGSRAVFNSPGGAVPGGGSFRQGGGSMTLALTASGAMGQPTSSFVTTPRSRKYGPHDWTTDSTLMRRAL